MAYPDNTTVVRFYLTVDDHGAAGSLYEIYHYGVETPAPTTRFPELDLEDALDVYVSDEGATGEPHTYTRLYINDLEEAQQRGVQVGLDSERGAYVEIPFVPVTDDGTPQPINTSLPDPPRVRCYNDSYDTAGYAVGAYVGGQYFEMGYTSVEDPFEAPDVELSPVDTSCPPFWMRFVKTAEDLGLCGLSTGEVRRLFVGHRLGLIRVLNADDMSVYKQGPSGAEGGDDIDDEITFSFHVSSSNPNDFFYNDSNGLIYNRGVETIDPDEFVQVDEAEFTEEIGGGFATTVVHDTERNSMFMAIEDPATTGGSRIAMEVSMSDFSILNKSEWISGAVPRNALQDETHVYMSLSRIGGPHNLRKISKSDLDQYTDYTETPSESFFNIVTLLDGHLFAVFTNDDNEDGSDGGSTLRKVATSDMTLADSAVFAKRVRAIIAGGDGVLYAYQDSDSAPNDLVKINPSDLSIITGVPLDTSATSLYWAGDNNLYVGYENGAVGKFDPESMVELQRSEPHPGNERVDQIAWGDLILFEE